MENLFSSANEPTVLAIIRHSNAFSRDKMIEQKWIWISFEWTKWFYSFYFFYFFDSYFFGSLQVRAQIIKNIAHRTSHFAWTRTIVNWADTNKKRFEQFSHETERIPKFLEIFPTNLLQLIVYHQTLESEFARSQTIFEFAWQSVSVHYFVQNTNSVANHYIQNMETCSFEKIYADCLFFVVWIEPLVHWASDESPFIWIDWKKKSILSIERIFCRSKCTLSISIQNMGESVPFHSMDASPIHLGVSHMQMNLNRAS